jgi:hypothetical protein
MESEVNTFDGGSTSDPKVLVGKSASENAG